MAARIRRIRNDDEIRNRIRTGLLLRRLHDNALGKLELTKIQQKSHEILLQKVLPNLTSTTLKGDQNNPLRWEAIQRDVIDHNETPKQLNGGPAHTNGQDIQAASDSEPV